MITEQHADSTSRVGLLMSKRSIHLSLCRCLKCNGPVVTAWFGVRETEIQREIKVGSCLALCLSCRDLPDEPAGATNWVRSFPSVEWD